MRSNGIRAKLGIPPFSIRFQLALLFVVVFGISLVVFSAVLYRAFESNHNDAFDTALYNYAVDVSQSINVDFFGDITVSPKFFQEAKKIFPFSLGDTLIQMLSADGHPIARSDNMGAFSFSLSNQELSYLEGQKVIWKTIRVNETTRGQATQYRMVATWVPRNGRNNWVLIVAAPLWLLEREQRGLKTFFGITIPVILILAALGGIFLSSLILRPVNRMIQEAQTLTVNDLSRRLPEPKTRDEIQALAQTLNNMFERLERAFKSQDEFIANASHQLKTPLAVIQGEIEHTLTQVEKESEAHQNLLSVRQEIQRLGRLVDDLLILARIETDKNALAFRTTRIDEVILEVASFLDRTARAKSIRINVSLVDHDPSDVGNFEVKADPGLVRTMVENLVSNAIKYSAPGSTILVEVTDQPSKIEIEVVDAGPGISPEIAPRLFRRFQRGENLKNLAEGFGLGLTVAQEIAIAHNGQIQLKATGPTGSRFVIQIPKTTEMKT